MSAELLPAPNNYEPVTVDDLQALRLTNENFGFYLQYIWPHAIDIMNFVLVNNLPSDVGLFEKSDLDLFELVDCTSDNNGRSASPLTVNEAQEVFIEITKRLSEIPLNSSDIAQAHILINGISFAHSIIRRRLNIGPHEKPYLPFLLGAET